MSTAGVRDKRDAVKDEESGRMQRGWIRWIQKQTRRALGGAHTSIT